VRAALTFALVALPATALAQTRAVGNATGYEIEGAPIADAELEEVPARVRTALEACAEAAVPLIGQSLRARIAIDPAGAATSARLDGEAAGDVQAARACVERGLATLRFGRRARPTTLILDLEIAAGRAAGPDPQETAYAREAATSIQRHQDAIRACFATSRGAREQPNESIQVRLTLDRNGRVTEAAVPAADVFPRLAECLLPEMRTWTLPRPPRAPYVLTHRLLEALGTVIE
jgi:hypothetical protein